MASAETIRLWLNTTCHTVEDRLPAAPKADGPRVTCRERSAEVGHLLEAQFHRLCRDCHMTRQVAGEPHRPTRRCLDFHVADSFP